jgi:hypothetical protein
MRFEQIYRAFKIVRAVADLAYLLGYKIGKKTRH